eukprot:TRINITY_DN1967_c0_g1_i11.p1 TRINITY_DN1967_c0_g1~~TRINITY_DN1967_c0_g1_i11.p1  ORF type:complete len:180 (+),score=42.82 TRINITY_DN1967_c0_g1_i11:44-583(+)
MSYIFFFQAEDGIRDHAQSRGLGDVYKRQEYMGTTSLMVLTHETRFLIFPTAVILGIGQSICLNTAMNLIAEVVGIRGSQGAFVYGAYSFTDKISNGIALYIIMDSQSMKIEDPFFIRWASSLMPAVGCAIALVLVLMGKAKDYSDAKGNRVENCAAHQIEHDQMINSSVSSLTNLGQS